MAYDYPPMTGERARRTLEGMNFRHTYDGGDYAYQRIADAVNELDGMNYPWEGDTYKAYLRVSPMPAHYVEGAQAIRASRLKKNRK